MNFDRMLCMLDSKKKINNRLAVGNKDRIKDKGSTLSSINCLSIHYKWKSDYFTSCGNQSIPPRVENKLSTSWGKNLSFHYKWKSEHFTSCGNQSIPPCVENKLSTSCGQKLPFPPCVGTLFCFTKLDNNNPIPIQLSQKSDCKTLLTNSITSQRHQGSNIKHYLMHDIETNPGPGEKLKIITIHCRGLGEIEKFRLLLNKAYDMM